jgi:hypothetical protein
VGTEKRERQKANRAQRQQEVERQATRKKTLRNVGLVVGAIVAIIAFVWIASEIVGGDEDDPTTPVPVPVVTESPDVTDAPVVTDAPPASDPVSTDG